jgi:hypothetical protein
VAALVGILSIQAVVIEPGDLLSARALVTAGRQLPWCHAAATAENGHGGAAAEEVWRPVPARAR